MIGTTAKLLALPPWVRIAAPVALAALVFGGGMWLMRQLDAAEIARLEGRVEVLEYAVKDRNGTIITLRSEAEATAKTLADNKAAMVAAQAELVDALARPPKVVVRWREAAAAAPDTIDGDQPTTTQVHQALNALQQALREREAP